MLRIKWTERNTKTWVREKVVVEEEEGLLCFINHWTYIVDSKCLERLKGDANGLTEDMAAQKEDPNKKRRSNKECHTKHILVP